MGCWLSFPPFSGIVDMCVQMCLYSCIAVRTDGWTDGPMDGWTDGWMDGLMDGYTYVRMYVYMHYMCICITCKHRYVSSSTGRLGFNHDFSLYKT